MILQRRILNPSPSKIKVILLYENFGFTFLLFTHYCRITMLAIGLVKMLWSVRLHLIRFSSFQSSADNSSRTQNDLKLVTLTNVFVCKILCSELEDQSTQACQLHTLPCFDVEGTCCVIGSINEITQCK